MAGIIETAQIDSGTAQATAQKQTGNAAWVLPVTSAGASVALAEDAAHASGDPGYQMLAVRKATPATLSGADGDYEPLQVSVGRLWTSAVVETNAELGVVTETAPTTDTASSGLNGRLQRIAQRLTTLMTANSEYETVAASQTAQALGATGAIGDFVSGILVIPATTSPGNVLLLDNATSITVFTGGASSVSNLVPFWINLGMTSVSGAWKVTTGANVSCIGVGNFT